MENDLNNIFDRIQEDDEYQMQAVVHRILSGPETDPEIILVSCLAAIQSIVMEMENPKEEIESLCHDLLSGTLKRIKEEI